MVILSLQKSCDSFVCTTDCLACLLPFTSTVWKRAAFIFCITLFCGTQKITKFGLMMSDLGINRSFGLVVFSKLDKQVTKSKLTFGRA